ncbi:trypsin-like serine peptidase [Saccharomonospora piscinae]|uniref:trypsin-like serine peptidase n=1 Tax=Saccharomonospora piscinae TaxID=687388 RepID=UPI000463B7C9|nr:hypothetical protein [Saccharomonospora piscinae]
MKRPLIRSLVAGIALAGGSAALAAPAGAATDPAASALDDVTGQAAAVVAGEQDRIEQYWSAERMEAAKPAEERFLGSGKAGAVTARAEAAAAGGVRAAAEPETPQPRLGKVFFTLGGTDYVCSGTATESGNGDVVTTAGHCLNEGPGDFATNFAFVPAYDNGDTPYGTWTAEHLYAPTQWAQSGDFNYDVGFAVMNENGSGDSLTDVVGSYPIAFDLPRGLSYTAYGYPAASPFDGEELYSCTGTARDDWLGSNDQGLTCDMTGGSSGGGWITDGQLNSVNSFKYTFDPNTMYGPYFGSVAQSAYTTAASA